MKVQKPKQKRAARNGKYTKTLHFRRQPSDNFGNTALNVNSCYSSSVLAQDHSRSSLCFWFGVSMRRVESREQTASSDTLLYVVMLPLQTSRPMSHASFPARPVVCLSPPSLALSVVFCVVTMGSAKRKLKKQEARAASRVLAEFPLYDHLVEQVNDGTLERAAAVQQYDEFCRRATHNWRHPVYQEEGGAVCRQDLRPLFQRRLIALRDGTTP